MESILNDYESPYLLEKNLPSKKIQKMSDFELHFHKVRLEKEIYNRDLEPVESIICDVSGMKDEDKKRLTHRLNNHLRGGSGQAQR